MIEMQERQKAEQADEPTLGYIIQDASIYNNDPELLKAALMNEKMWIAIAVNVTPRTN
jgi:hypothetical protein